MSAERAAPCRHPGAPAPDIVSKVSSIVKSLGLNEAFLSQHGLTSNEYVNALPAAIEALRGSQSATTGARRKFVFEILNAMRERKLIEALSVPSYGDDTVYELTLKDGFKVALIQKGCPDGNHSSVRWSVPEWADETYLWWLCSSLKSEPGQHVAKGINRLRNRFMSTAPDTIDGVIFSNELCGSPERPCPKLDLSIEVQGKKVPPPCIYIMPDRAEQAVKWNWDDGQKRVFPSVLLSLFGISSEQAQSYIGYAGFREGADGIRTTITSRYGPARITTFRS
jgi:hypothetical protein